MTSPIAGSMSRCPHAMRVCSPIAPAQNGASSATNGTYIAADISAMARQEWPRNRIQAPIPIAMLVAMTRTPTSAPTVTAGRTRSSNPPSVYMPTSIAPTISR
jgi:hypothetical protein